MSKITKKIPENVRPKTVYNGTKLSSFFSVKDKVKTEHISNLVYYYQNRRDEDSDYTGETKGVDMENESVNTKEGIKNRRSSLISKRKGSHLRRHPNLPSSEEIILIDLREELLNHSLSRKRSPVLTSKLMLTNSNFSIR